MKILLDPRWKRLLRKKEHLDRVKQNSVRLLKNFKTINAEYCFIIDFCVLTKKCCKRSNIVLLLQYNKTTPRPFQAQDPIAGAID